MRTPKCQSGPLEIQSLCAGEVRTCRASPPRGCTTLVSVRHERHTFPVYTCCASKPNFLLLPSATDQSTSPRTACVLQERLVVQYETHPFPSALRLREADPDSISQQKPRPSVSEDLALAGPKQNIIHPCCFGWVLTGSSLWP